MKLAYSTLIVALISTPAFATCTQSEIDALVSQAEEIVSLKNSEISASEVREAFVYITMCYHGAMPIQQKLAIKKAGNALYCKYHSYQDFRTERSRKACL